jgi:hypothetical protein
VIPVYVGSCCAVFKVRGEAVCRGAELGQVPDAPAAAGLSKLDSMRRTANGPSPGPVDVLGAGARFGAGGIQRCSLERR